MKRELLATGMAVMVGLASAGCASTSQTDADFGGAESQQTQQTTVEVTNNHELLVTVEAVSSGLDQRLGQVAANQTETFTLPESVNESDLRIQVEPIGSLDSFLSPQILVNEGDRVTVSVESNLDLTTVSVR